jgi:hypothetical protein
MSSEFQAKDKTNFFTAENAERQRKIENLRRLRNECWTENQIPDLQHCFPREPLNSLQLLQVGIAPFLPIFPSQKVQSAA